MGFIPDDAKWYLAEIVVENSIEGERVSVVYVNIVLVRADSPEEAYQRALELGHDSESTYENTDGKQVTVSFRGLRDLNVIHDELEHGAELIYERKVGLTSHEVEALTTPKSELGVFRPRRPASGPNLMPLSIARRLDEYVNEMPDDEQNEHPKE